MNSLNSEFSELAHIFSYGSRCVIFLSPMCILKPLTCNFLAFFRFVGKCVCYILSSALVGLFARSFFEKKYRRLNKGTAGIVPVLVFVQMHLRFDLGPLKSSMIVWLLYGMSAQGAI